MKCYDNVLDSKLNHNIIENIGLQYQPSIYNKPMISNSAPISFNALSDVEGLQRAYARDNGIYIYIYIRNNTMVVAGTKGFPHDAWDDVSKKPCRTTYNSLRYINADKAAKHIDSLCPDNKITSIVGHSLGGPVILDMQKQYPDKTFKTTTYGAPVMSMTTPDTINNKRFRTNGDPISMFDRGSIMVDENPLTIQNYLNIKSPSNIVGVATKLLNKHSYDKFTASQIDNTSQDTFAYTTDA